MGETAKWMPPELLSGLGAADREEHEAGPDDAREDEGPLAGVRCSRSVTAAACGAHRGGLE